MVKSVLSSIQEFVQQVVDAVAAALGVEVMVFDLDLNIVAGTGETKAEVGSRYNGGSLTGRLLENGQPILARSPGRSLECKSCTRYGTCQHYFVVAYPIKMDGQILGSLCLVAIDEQQRQRFLENEENLLRFLDHMCLLICSSINERQIQDKLNVLLERYDNVVNSVHEGIIATDDNGQVIHLNRSAANLLGLESTQILGTTISDLFSGLPLLDDVLVRNKRLETEISYQYKRKKRYFLATVVPTIARDSQKIRGATISLRNLSEVQSYATKLVGEYSKYSFDDIQGESQGIRRVKEKLRKAALTDSTILIRGESGTGKELFAHSVHSASHRAKRPFLAINCSAIPESLLESELFGYEEGAFTGAKKGGKPGKFELANGGTLFLDEIGDMPLHLQSKLLRVLESRSIERVGGTEPINIDVRIIAATNRNLEEMVERREYRGDLYYRLSVIPVFVPPLRDRREDIPCLINHFLAKYCTKMERDIQELDPIVKARLINYDWPGNVRELQNAVEYAINMSEPGESILLEHLPQRILLETKLEEPSYEQSILANATEDNEAKLKMLESKAIKEAINRFGNTTAGKLEAARYLGISLATLYRRLKEIS